MPGPELGNWHTNLNNTYKGIKMDIADSGNYLQGIRENTEQ